MYADKRGRLRMSEGACYLKRAPAWVVYRSHCGLESGLGLLQ